MKTKIFCDIADISSIKKFNNKSIVKGFTTNPSLMRKAGAKDYKSYSKKILKVCKNKPISFEVFADDQKSMIEQGKEINSWGKNVYVKVPVVNSKNKLKIQLKKILLLISKINWQIVLSKDKWLKLQLILIIMHLISVDL